MVTGEPESRLLAVAVVPLLGTQFLAVLTRRIGEADVGFIAGMASLLTFWSLVLSSGLACSAALPLYLWMFRNTSSEAILYPVPFLPSLYRGSDDYFGGVLL